ncbi:hypothetical protein [Vibrio jasicida]
MIEAYNDITKLVPKDLSATEKVTFYTSVLRSILQASTYASLELCSLVLPENEVDLEAHLIRMQQPSDGLPIEIIESILPSLRTYFDTTVCFGWYKEGKEKQGLAHKLSEWVHFRNDTAGHGVLGEKDAVIWAEKTLELIYLCLTVFEKLLPSYNSKTDTLELRKHTINFPLIRDGLPVVVRKITCNKGLWKLQARLLNRLDPTKFVVELNENCIYQQSPHKNKERYQYSELVDVESNGVKHSFLHNVPKRQTDIFEGRGKEIQKLTDWLNDDDERTCLVFGDGGFGKTTLVLEFINRLFEEKIPLVNPRPLVISFYSAKMTRWTEHGLIHIKSVAGAMDECIRELIRGFEPVLSKDWYEATDEKLVQKAINYLKEEGVDRNDVLFVFDNTETIATSTHEVEALGEFLQLVSKKLGKMIITSRRREFISATPISVRGLTEEECISLLTRQATSYEAMPLVQAGDSRLKAISKQLMYKPLLISSLVKHISLTGCSISTAVDSLLKKSSDELLEFLYEDAWARMSKLQQKVYLLLVTSESPLDQFSVSEACKIMSIPLTEFHATFDETYFGSMNNFGEKFDIELEELANRFFNKKVNDLPEKERKKLNESVAQLDITVTKLHEIENDYETDRVADAFRTSYAKAARTHVRREEYPEALEMYDYAIEDDPLNSALRDRFAWFLYHKIRSRKARSRAEALWREAININSHNCDALVNLAISRYRNNDIEEGDELIDKARQLSRSYSFCALNKAKARFHYWQRNRDLSSSQGRLIEAVQLLDQARRKLNPKEQYYAKNRAEIEKLSAQIKQVAINKQTTLA